MGAPCGYAALREPDVPEHAFPSSSQPIAARNDPFTAEDTEVRKGKSEKKEGDSPLRTSASSAVKSPLGWGSAALCLYAE